MSQHTEYPALRILIVDDVQSARWAIKQSLSQLGLTDVEEAKNGKEALDRLRSAKFHLVISDWDMKELDGIGLLHAAKELPGMQDLGFILVTGSASKQAVLEAAKAGVSDYIIKPFSPQTLADKIQSVLKRMKSVPSPNLPS